MKNKSTKLKQCPKCGGSVKGKLFVDGVLVSENKGDCPACGGRGYVT